MIANPNTPATAAAKGMYCKVFFQMPDGRKMEHEGRYATPYAAMKAVEAEVPGAVAKAGIALKKPGIVWRKGERSCDALGVCQRQPPAKACPSYSICERKSTAATPHYFAPGVIDGAPSAEQMAGDDTQAIQTTWMDWAGGLAIMVILFCIFGYVK